MQVPKFVWKIKQHFHTRPLYSWSCRQKLVNQLLIKSHSWKSLFLKILRYYQLRNLFSTEIRIVTCHLITWRLGVDESEFCRRVLFGEVLPETNVRLDNVVRRVSFLCVYNAEGGQVVLLALLCYVWYENFNHFTILNHIWPHFCVSKNNPLD